MRSVSKENIANELKRWFPRYRILSLESMIENRQIMWHSHLRVMGYDGDRIKQLRTRNERGNLIHFAKKMSKRYPGYKMFDVDRIKKAL